MSIRSPFFESSPVSFLGVVSVSIMLTIYISEPILNKTNDKWLTPQEFLEDTPEYPFNPVRGQVVSDCEEQANALVSVLRALGIPPENVRVTIGEVLFNQRERGHVWVELFLNNQWLVLDPTCGPYWDDATDKLVQRKTLPFCYYSTHHYPILQIWVYYNDIYSLDVPSAYNTNLRS